VVGAKITLLVHTGLTKHKQRPQNTSLVMPAVVIFHSVPANNAIFALTMEWVQRREGTKLVHGIAHLNYDDDYNS